MPALRRGDGVASRDVAMPALSLQARVLRRRVSEGGAVSDERRKGSDRRTGKDRRSGDERRKRPAPPPDEDRRSGDERRTGDDRRERDRRGS